MHLGVGWTTLTSHHHNCLLLAFLVSAKQTMPSKIAIQTHSKTLSFGHCCRRLLTKPMQHEYPQSVSSDTHQILSHSILQNSIRQCMLSAPNPPKLRQVNITRRRIKSHIDTLQTTVYRYLWHRRQGFDPMHRNRYIRGRIRQTLLETCHMLRMMSSEGSRIQTNHLTSANNPNELFSS